MLSKNIKELKRNEDFFAEWELKRLRQLSEQFDKLEEFQNLYSQEDALYRQLMEAIPEELTALLVKYNNTLNGIITHQQDFFYRNGFLDCFNQLKSSNTSIEIQKD